MLEGYSNQTKIAINETRACLRFFCQQGLDVIDKRPSLNTGQLRSDQINTL
ncbi:hypothetical protein PMI18_00074 [Pseudomonas sp. GM102]|nr:hypothetical protein PMI18_00074 [Pseudomonas sp. GM102]